ncbi:MAG: hypothetical protein GXP40_11390 [Chloroflexi bacterium]|nr:hypothetical protein [Chloroflexota bacterium]
MKTNRRLYPGLALMAVLTFACSLLTPPTGSQPPPAAAPASSSPQAALPPTSLPGPAVAPGYLPTGVVTGKGNDAGLTIFDRQGYTILEIGTPGLLYSAPTNVHIAGALPQGSASVPVVYFSFEQNESLLLNVNQQITTLLTTPFFAGLVGAPGKPIVAYTTTDFDVNADVLRSQLYVGTVQSLPTAAPVLTEEDPQGWALVALAIDVEGDQPVGVWYSKRPWGIGGDIVFDPRRTLYYLNLATGASFQILGAEANPSALSVDRTWVAYSDDASVGAGVGAMTIRNLQAGANITFPLLPATDPRGAGAATFSPGNQYVAWMEGSGWQMAEVPNFHSVVRVGNMNGNLIADFADTALVTASGLNVVRRVEPVGWFDDQTLVVMARGDDWDQAVLISVDIPSQTASFLARGVFLGFVYP